MKPEVQKLFKKAEQAIKRSTYLKDIQAYQRFNQKKYRKLTEAELNLLISQGNRSENWSNIFVSKGFKTDHIHQNEFLGKAYLGVLSGLPHPQHPVLKSGLYSSTFGDVIIEDECLVHRTDFIHKVVLCKGAASIANGKLVHTQNGPIQIEGGIECCNEVSPKRLSPFPEIELDLIKVLTSPETNKDISQNYQALYKNYLQKSSSQWSILAQNALIENTAHAETFYIGPSASVCNISLLYQSILLSSSDEPSRIEHHSIVRNSMIQWGNSITDHSIVDYSFLSEFTIVERQALVKHSVIGPNTHLGEGEISHSFVGPFVGMHHHSLLIATYWPEGKGNIGYGANVGSNHTGRSPDQELHAGEGLFFGLSTSIKFPCHTLDAPYSILSTGITLLPQKLAMPFSLINQASSQPEGVSPAYNEIFPGWVVEQNLYMIVRNQNKYLSRNRATHSQFPLTILRSDLVEKVILAREQLQDLEESHIYDDRDFFGLGKNFMREPSRQSGIKAYSFFIQWFCCEAFLNAWIQSGSDPEIEFEALLKRRKTGADWNLAKKLWPKEMGCRSSFEALNEALIMKKRVLKGIEMSRKKDAERSKRIFGQENSNYVASDSVIKTMRKELKELEKRLT